MTISVPQRFGLALLCLLGVTALVTWSHSDRVQVYGAIIGMLLVLPVNILLYRDMARSLGGTASPGLAFGLALPIRILGVVSFISGVTVLGWIIYHLVVDRHGRFPVESVVHVFYSLALIAFGRLCIKYPLGSPKENAGDNPPPSV